MRSWEEVHRLHREGLSERAIARKLNASRNTVHRLLNCPVATPYGRNSGSLLNPFKHCIASLLEQDPTMPATVVKRHLDALGYAGGISILREHLAAIRPDVQASHGALLSAARPVKIEDSSIRSLTSGLMDAGIDNQPGMNLISSDFDIMMVNRTNERLFRKPAKEMLGKKCYEEFERRVDVCPHCPGVATLATGQPHSVETWGIRDDGTKYRVRITAYPIPDPRGDLLGFVELEEDITEQRRAEEFANLFQNLHNSLLSANDVRGAVRQALHLAFGLQGVDFGCAYLKIPGIDSYQAIAQRGACREVIETLVGAMSNPLPSETVTRHPAAHQSVGPEDIPGFNGSALLVPILVHNEQVARLIVGSLTYCDFPAVTKSALETLGEVTGATIATLEGRQFERDLLNQLTSLLRRIPLPVWTLDQEERIALWNTAAERLLGWQAHEMVGSRLPTSETDAEKPRDSWELGASVETKHLTLFNKAGGATKLTATTVYMNAAHSSLPAAITLVQDWSAAAPEHSESPSECTDLPHSTLDLAESGCSGVQASPTRVMVLDHDDRERERLRTLFSQAGCAVVTCRTVEESVERYQASLKTGAPFAVAIGPLIAPSGCGGLELVSCLRGIDPAARVFVGSDAPIAAMESLGFAGRVKRPCSESEVRRLASEWSRGYPDS